MFIPNARFRPIGDTWPGAPTKPRDRGDPELFVRLQEARRVLDQHGGS